MSAYFVYRSHYEGPAGKHVRRLEAGTVLDWFQRVWPEATASGDARRWEEQALGCSTPDFWAFFHSAGKARLPPPDSERALREYLEGHLGVRGEVRYRPHAMQALTDDELGLAYYLFDDIHIANHPERTAYLTHEGWRLPAGSADGGFRPKTATRPLRPAGDGEGHTWLVFLEFDSADNLEDLGWGARRFDGVQLPRLCRHLLESKPDPDEWPAELVLLRAQVHGAGTAKGCLHQALRGAARFPLLDLSIPDEAFGPPAEARKAFEDWLGRRRRHPNGADPAKSVAHTEEHLAQLCLHVAARRGGRDLFHQWVLFDDCWGAAHPHLADSLLRYSRRWDVL
jgi:hypothetical protein